MTDVNKGKSVKCTKLVAGATYVMSTWGKQKTFDTVQFIGIGATVEEATGKSPTGNLKTQMEGAKFFFSRNGEVLEVASNVDRTVVLLNGLRVTFLLPGETAEEQTARIVADMAVEHGLTIDNG